ncbi:hypothetical protein E1A91_D07G090100v1 [Gossypium mustelinum]|uniref:Uncharacterized protein n=4 Tax=Gossypium TaxID=3633 RepID=A0A5J5QQ76_GOSBA|nr:hypothetical protein ES319_D07G087400v1 [Gossypium barbadense]TYG60749.1 hypothetical protein ES288_D07G092300v1 [Gossypium darwinii]TYH62043.1 hypothetical protein ES332_D07G091800v1 [Gossypium tomentosum]TYI72878.1 hypothetical protein E1A91_D07G090100v1 [Gossypium mustelinum]
MVVKFGCVQSAAKFPAIKFFISPIKSYLPLQVLGATDYYCPTFKVKFNFELSDSEKWQPKNKSKTNNSQLVLPNKVTVLCCGVEGIYYPSLHSFLGCFS